MLFFFGLLASLLVHNARALDGEGIIGGIEVEPNEIKYQISLQTSGRHLCGGGIIDEQFVLTAAHCVINEDDSFETRQLSVVAGINDLNEASNTKVEVEVVKVYVPDTYNGSVNTPFGDIAVLKLKNKLDLDSNPGLSKLNLPPSTESKLTSSNSFAHSPATIAGFGWNKVKVNVIQISNLVGIKEDGSTDGKLLKAKALITSNDECQSLSNNVIRNTHLCANVVQHPDNVHQGVCSGDSGGPLVHENTVVGTVSYNGVGCDDRLRPAVYTRVSAYIDFIQNAKNDDVSTGIRYFSW